jgi:hypothetical protein
VATAPAFFCAHCRTVAKRILAIVIGAMFAHG